VNARQGHPSRRPTIVTLSSIHMSSYGSRLLRFSDTDVLNHGSFLFGSKHRKKSGLFDFRGGVEYETDSEPYGRLLAPSK